ncbi:RNA polymerase sigma factor [candidate division KSB1 bacterium]
MKKIITGSDEQLFRQCAHGDQDTFEILFKKYARQLVYFIYQIIQDYDRAHDLFQDTFLKILENIDKYDDRYRFSTWIYRIALNLSINELRKKQREKKSVQLFSSSDRPDDMLSLLDAVPDPDTLFDIVEKRDRADLVKESVRQLPGPKRVAFILKFYHDLSYKEIADIIGCSEGTVKSRVHYAVEQLQILAGE